MTKAVNCIGREHVDLDWQPILLWGFIILLIVEGLISLLRPGWLWGLYNLGLAFQGVDNAQPNEW